MALPDFEREVLKLRDECVEKAKKIIAQELPMFQGEALPLQEMILPKRDLEKLLKERPSAVVLPPVTSPLVSPLLPSRELPTPAIGSPALGSPPPKKLEALEPISVQRQSPVLNTENRMALQRLAACETSLIHIHGTVNGEPLYVGYDTVKQRIISDAASAERMGVRFLDTGEKGPNGLPKIQVEFTLPGQFSAEYNGVNLRTAARWSGSVSSPTPLQKNMARLEEAQNLGKDRWHKDMQSAARVPDGTKYHYAYSSEDARLYARSPDGKSTLAFDPQKNSWHSVSPAKLPPCLQGGGTPSGLAV